MTAGMHHGSIDSPTSEAGRVFRALYIERWAEDADGHTVHRGGRFTTREIAKLIRPRTGEHYAPSTVVSSVRLQLEARADCRLYVPRAEWDRRQVSYRMVERLPQPQAAELPLFAGAV